MTSKTDEMRNKVSQYTPGNLLGIGGHGFQRVSLQLYGRFGHGKTTIINLCMSVVQNKPYEDHAGVGWSDGSVIRERREHRLTNTLYINDNRGFIKMDQEELTEASAQLRSLRFVEEAVQWDRSMEEKLELLLEKYNTAPTEFIVPVIVYRGTFNLSTEEVLNMKTFILKTFDITGIFPIVLLTESGDSLEKIRNNFHLLGVSNVIALQSFKMEQPARDAETDDEILRFLTLCINEADRGIRKRQRLGREEGHRRQAREQMRLELELERERVRRETRDEMKREQEVAAISPNSDT
ncbi:uncharacterized protein WCC33_013160 [Rhinophrynus dorsalis]